MSEKRKVTMTSVDARIGADGKTVIAEHKAVDYVPADVVDAYVADAQTRWQHVTVGDEHDSGPGGDDGDTAELNHLIGA